MPLQKGCSNECLKALLGALSLILVDAWACGSTIASKGERILEDSNQKQIVSQVLPSTVGSMKLYESRQCPFSIQYPAQFTIVSAKPIGPGESILAVPPGMHVEDQNGEVFVVAEDSEKESTVFFGGHSMCSEEDIDKHFPAKDYNEVLEEFRVPPDHEGKVSHKLIQTDQGYTILVVDIKSGPGFGGEGLFNKLIFFLDRAKNRMFYANLQVQDIKFDRAAQTYKKWEPLINYSIRTFRIAEKKPKKLNVKLLEIADAAGNNIKNGATLYDPKNYSTISNKKTNFLFKVENQRAEVTISITPHKSNTVAEKYYLRSHHVMRITRIVEPGEHYITWDGRSTVDSNRYILQGEYLVTIFAKGIKDKQVVSDQATLKVKKPYTFAYAPMGWGGSPDVIVRKKLKRLKDGTGFDTGGGETKDKSHPAKYALQKMQQSAVWFFAGHGYRDGIRYELLNFDEKTGRGLYYLQPREFVGDPKR